MSIVIALESIANFAISFLNLASILTLYLSAVVNIYFIAPAHFLLIVPIRLSEESLIMKLQAFQSPVIIETRLFDVSKI